MFAINEELHKKMSVLSVAVTKYLVMQTDMFYSWNVWSDKAM
jgi:hypothetical protein